MDGSGGARQGRGRVRVRVRGRACLGFLAVVDSLLSIVVFAPLVVGYWRGCWQIMDAFLLPGDKQLSVATSLAIGIASGLLFCLLQGPLDALFDHSRRPGLHLLASRLYTSVYCVCCVNHWRGVWAAWDLYTGISWQSGATSTGIGLLTLAVTRGLKNILAPPFLVVPDHPTGYFTVPTLFSAKKERCGYFLLDTVFTVVITGSLVVFVWRGFWVFLDAMLFPGQPVYSAWGSMVLGMTVTVLVFLAQLVLIPCLRHLRKGLAKILLEDAYHTICFVGDVNMWRGVWMLLNIYLLPGLPVLSNFLTSVGGLVALMCFYASNSILVRGAVMDGAGEGSRSLVFPTHYLRFFHEKRREELEERREELWSSGAAAGGEDSGCGDRPQLLLTAAATTTSSSPATAVVSTSSAATSVVAASVGSTKVNGVCDGRGGFSDGFGGGSPYAAGEAEEPGRCARPNFAFVGDLQPHHGETHL